MNKVFNIYLKHFKIKFSILMLLAKSAHTNLLQEKFVNFATTKIYNSVNSYPTKIIKKRILLAKTFTPYIL